MIQLPREILEFIIRYILNAGVDKDAFDVKILQISHLEIQSSAMTIAQQLRQEGRQEGRKKALQEGVLEALAIRFEQVPAGLGDAIEAVGDEVRLQGLRKASIQATSLEDFARNL